MFNLLPDSLKDVVKSEYRIRFLTVVCITIIFLQLFFFISIFPSWFVTYSREYSAVSQKENASSSSLDSSESSSVFISKANAELKALDGSLTHPKPLQFMQSILSDKISDIRINQFSYTVTSSKTAIFSVGGVASSRDTLVRFRGTLESSKLFKTVDLPVSSLVKDKNLQFIVNMTIEIQ